MPTSAEIDRPSPGSWWIGDLDLANHEAAHAVVAVLLGSRRVVEVRIDRPEGRLGFSKSMSERDPSMADLESALLSTLAGPYVGGTPLELPPEGETTDAQNARMLGRILGLDSTGWWIIGLRLEALLERPSTRRALRAVTRALLQRGALSGPEVHRLVEEVR